jgi:hypothetical protein
MDSSSKLRELAIEVNDLLSQYIKIHNRRIKETGTLLSLFRKKDYKGIDDEATIIYLKISVKQKEIGELKDTRFFKDLSPGQKDCFVKLAEYVDALTQTTFLLSEMVNLEYRRSQNMGDLPYKEFMNAHKEYEESRINCQNIGKQLQYLYEKMNCT